MTTNKALLALALGLALAACTNKQQAADCHLHPPRKRSRTMA